MMPLDPCASGFILAANARVNFDLATCKHDRPTRQPLKLAPLWLVMSCNGEHDNIPSLIMTNSHITLRY